MVDVHEVLVGDFALEQDVLVMHLGHLRIGSSTTNEIRGLNGTHLPIFLEPIFRVYWYAMMVGVEHCLPAELDLCILSRRFFVQRRPWKEDVRFVLEGI